MENIEEVQQEESSISSRRSALLMGGAALAGLMFSRHASAQAATIGDPDILNFALNLEYLEANYYSLATSGQTLQQAGGTISGNGGAGGTVTVKSSPMVNFTTANLKAYAMETAMDERNHVATLQAALGSAAVAMPNIDLMNSFNALAVKAGLGSTFDPFSSETNFLIGAYIFEDVGVTAYLGAAPLITTPATLTAALDIHAVEAYHAGSVRTQIFAAGTAAQGITQMISAARQSLAGAGIDEGVGTLPNGALGMTGSTIVDVDPTTAIIVGRTTDQVLNIVYGGGAIGTGGAFFPSGMNGTIR